MNETELCYSDVASLECMVDKGWASPLPPGRRFSKPTVVGVGRFNPRSKHLYIRPHCQDICQEARLLCSLGAPRGSLCLAGEGGATPPPPRPRAPWRAALMKAWVSGRLGSFALEGTDPAGARPEGQARVKGASHLGTR